RIIVVLAWCVWAAWVFVHVRDRVRGFGLLLAGFLVLTPTLHPWYLTWIVPFLALRRSPAWSALVVAAPLLYWPLERWREQGRWDEPDWLWPALALPFWGLLVLDLARQRGA